MGDVQDSPESRRKVVRLFLILAAPAFLFCYVLAAIQGAGWWLSSLVGGILAASCLGAAAAYHLFGPASKRALYIFFGILAVIALVL